MNRAGLTLLETMIALVILGLVVTGFLAVFQGATRLAGDSARWSDAVAYAEDAVEAVKLDPRGAAASYPTELPRGFERSVSTRPWDAGLELVTVVVRLPGGARMTLHRLVELP